MKPEPSGMSIGALSKATGVPIETLRTWERRYGFPGAERTESGHRRYSLETLSRLRQVVRAIELGHRPSTVLLADPAALEGLLAATDDRAGLERLAQLDAQAAIGAYEPSARAAELIERWLGHVERYEGRALDRELAAAAADIGGLPFLDRLVGPFLRELGERWAQGRLGVGHEHFASERVRELLARQWRPLADAATGPVLVLATPAGEQHVLGLHMAALALAANNARIVFLGANAPASEIAGAVAHHAASAVVLSAALGIDRRALAAELRGLRAALPEGVPIVAGGRGFEPRPEGVRVVGPLSELVAWLQTEA